MFTDLGPDDRSILTNRAFILSSKLLSTPPVRRKRVRSPSPEPVLGPSDSPRSPLSDLSAPISVSSTPSRHHWSPSPSEFLVEAPVVISGNEGVDDQHRSDHTRAPKAVLNNAPIRATSTTTSQSVAKQRKIARTASTQPPLKRPRVASSGALNKVDLGKDSARPVSLQQGTSVNPRGLPTKTSRDPSAGEVKADGGEPVLRLAKRRRVLPNTPRRTLVMASSDLPTRPPALQRPRAAAVATIGGNSTSAASHALPPSGTRNITHAGLVGANPPDLSRKRTVASRRVDSSVAGVGTSTANGSHIERSGKRNGPPS